MEVIAKSNNKTFAPKLVHTMTEKEKRIFYDYQIEATRKDVERSRNWSATALERVGHVVVCH